MVCLDFSLIGSDPKVSHLCIGWDCYVYCGWREGSLTVGGSFETDSAVYSVRKRENYSLQLVQFYQGKVFFYIKNFILKFVFFKIKYCTLLWLFTSRNDYCPGRDTIGECLTWLTVLLILNTVHVHTVLNVRISFQPEFISYLVHISVCSSKRINIGFTYSVQRWSLNFYFSM